MRLIFCLLFLIVIPEVPKPKKQQNVQKVKILIPLPNKKREFIEPEKVGLPKDFEIPCVKNRICFQCPCCGFGMSTHVLYRHLPACPKDGCIMPEVDKIEKK